MELGNFVSLDLETTGLNPKEDTVIEIAAVRVQNGKPWSPVYYWRPDLCTPHTRDIKTGEIHLHFGPSNNPYDFLKEYCGDVSIIGYNINFDMRFLNPFLAQHSVVLDNPTYCVYKLAKKILKLESYKLGNVAIHYGVALGHLARTEFGLIAEYTEGKHFAFSDAIALAEVFMSMRPELEKMGVHSFEDIGKLEQGRLRRI